MTLVLITSSFFAPRWLPDVRMVYQLSRVVPRWTLVYYYPFVPDRPVYKVLDFQLNPCR